MKNLIVTFCCCLCVIGLFAQAPEKMSYQAVVRNNNNALVSNTAVGMRLSILQGSISGAAVYVETQTPTTNAAGVVALEIGGGTVVSGSMAAIAWENGPFFIKTETDIAGGTNYTISGTSQLLSVPYALYAKTAGSVAGGSTGGGHYVGEFFGGGIVFYVDGTGQHGLIVSTENLSEGCAWSNVTNAAVGTNRSNGQANTTAIIAQPGHTQSAAKLCDDYTGGGFTDWYLPAAYEFADLGLNMYKIDNVMLNDNNPLTLPIDPLVQADILGSSIFDGYWTSTEKYRYDGDPISEAVSIFIIQGYSTFYYLGQYDKSYSQDVKVRAVRAF